jgi:hypothetical protein
MRHPAFNAHALRVVVALLASTFGAMDMARAFGDEGHEVVALVARTQLTERAATEADRLLKLDSSAFKMRDGGMTSDSWERQATWADYYRESQRTPGALPEQIHSYAWHFVDIEISGGSLENACFNFPKAVPGTPASQGPDPDCIVNKIEEFTAELASPAAPDTEKALALKFLMHFVGDIHQPLHAADNLDHGGNKQTASVGTVKTALHSHWDTTFVAQIGAAAGQSQTDPQAIVAALRKPTPTEVSQWSGPANPRAWALESYALAQSYVYGPLPTPTTSGSSTVYVLSTAYAKNATAVTANQLLKAGYRLAAILNAAL